MWGPRAQGVQVELCLSETPRQLQSGVCGIKSQVLSAWSTMTVIFRPILAYISNKLSALGYISLFVLCGSRSKIPRVCLTVWPSMVCFVWKHHLEGEANKEASNINTEKHKRSRFNWVLQCTLDNVLQFIWARCFDIFPLQKIAQGPVLMLQISYYLFDNRGVATSKSFLHQYSAPRRDLCFSSA